MDRRRNGSLFENGRGGGLGAAFTTAKQRGAEHEGRRVEDDDDHEPTQCLERHGFNDESGDADSGMPPNREAERDSKVDLVDLVDLDNCRRGSSSAAVKYSPPS